MQINDNNPIIEVAKSPAGEPIEDNGVPADADGAMISSYNQEGYAQSDDVTATREVISATTLPLSYQYDEKQMMANVSTAISADIEDMTEAELLGDETFGYSSKKMFRAFRGEDFTGTDEEATQFGIDLMRRVENNLVELGDFAVRVQDMSEDDAKIALYMMDMFEAKEFTGRGFAEALGYMGLDPTTYIGISTLGFGFAGKEAVKAATKQSIKATLQKIAYSAPVIGAVEGALYTGAFEHGKQVVSEAAGEGYDSGSVGLNIAVGAGFGGVAGKYLPEIFDYAGEKVAKWSAAKNFKAEVRAAADAGDEDAIRVLADMKLLDNHFDSDGFMKRKLDNGVQRIVPQSTKSIDEIISDVAGLNAKQRKQKLSAAMRDVSPEDKQKLIVEMKKEVKPPKPKSEKQKEVILEQEEFNASFYSKLEHEVNKLPDDMVFQNGQELVNYMRKQGVKQDEIDATGFDATEGNLIVGKDVKISLQNRKDTITKRTYDDDSESEALDREAWENEWISINEVADVGIGDTGVGTIISDDSILARREIGIVYNDDVVEYIDSDDRRFDTMQEAIDSELDYMHEDYTQDMGERGAEIFSNYTVDGGDDYRLEVYQMKDFTPPTGKKSAQEPHFDNLEHGSDNVQVHARMKTREDADGRTGTILEEIQSQWEQDWRKAGGGKEAPTIATPPIKNRTQYTKLAMLDNLLNSLEKGESFFGWINGHIQNGNSISTTQGMSQAYDIEMPRIIQKATGETPYMQSFGDGRAIGQKDINDEAKIYWDSKNAQDLEYYDNLAKEETNEKWYWKIDYTDALKKKLKDAKIQMYGVGGISLVGASGESLEGDSDAKQ